MAYIQLKTSSTQSVPYGINGMFIPFGFTMYDISRLFAQALINIYHGVVIGALEVGPETPNGLNDIYDSIRLNVPNTEIILTQDPYDALGNVVRFLSTVDDSIGRDGDVLISTVDFKMYKRENGIYVFKFQMQGGSGIAVAAQWHFSESINNSLGVDGDLLLRPGGQIYKKINGTYVYQMLITGNAGTNGTNGIDGTQIYISTGANYSGPANENDLNIVDGINLYRYSSGFWVLVGAIRGITGLKGDKGEIGESSEIFVTNTFTSALGKDGDIVINPETLGVYKKILGAYVLQATLATPEGSLWHFNATPDDAIGKDGDMLLVANGDVHKKVSGVYLLQTNIKGPQGPQGNNGTNGTNGINGLDGLDGENGSQIHFMSVINNSTGANGDIAFVGPDVYQKVNGVYELKGSIGSSGGSGSGFIDWATIVNDSIINLTTTYQPISVIEIKDGATNSEITNDSGVVSISAGGWDLDISSFGDGATAYFLKVTVGATTLVEKYVKCGNFNVSRYIYLETSEQINIYMKSNKTCSIPIDGLSLNLSKISLIYTGGGTEDLYDTVVTNTPDYRYIANIDSTSHSLTNEGTNSALNTERPTSNPYAGSTKIFGKTLKYERIDNGYIKITGLHSENIRFYGTLNFTLSMFVKIDGFLNGFYYAYQTTFQTNSACGETGVVFLDSGLIILRANRAAPCDGNGFVDTTSTLKFPMGEWFCYTLSYNGTTRTYKIYINGVEFISYTQPRNLSNSTNPDKLIINGYYNGGYGSASNLLASYSDIRIVKGLFVSAPFSMSGTSLKARYVNPLIDINEASCSSKNIYTINTSSSNTVVPLDSSMTDADIIYVNLSVSTSLSFALSNVDNKKVLIYIVQDPTTPKLCTINTTNMVFNGSILSSDLVVSSTANDIDMLGIQYNQAESKWEVLSFLNNVF